MLNTRPLSISVLLLIEAIGSDGEMLRDSNDQTLTIDPCNLQYLYQGLAPGAGGDYHELPYRLGLLTQTNSPC